MEACEGDIAEFASNGNKITERGPELAEQSLYRSDPYTTADGRQYRNGRLIVRSSH